MLKVGGFTPMSTTDWPDHLAAVVFVQGCPWRCVYCHNPALQPREGGLPGGWTHVLGTLSRRVGLLDGVVFSGGEPTLDPELPDAIETVRTMGFKVGLHTAGIYPDRLAAVLPLVDWVGFDIKADFADYEAITGIPRSGLPTWRSLNTVLQAMRHRDLGLEVRTTYHPDLHNDEQMLTLAHSLKNLGVAQWVIQLFRDSAEVLPEYLSTSAQAPSKQLLAKLQEDGMHVDVR